ncbi:MAG: peptidylprolyl isomerase [Sedimentisphaerales bacterium]
MRPYLERFKSRVCSAHQKKWWAQPTLRLFIFYFSLLVIAWHLACRPKAPTEADANAPSDSVAVTVNGVDITESDVEALVKPELDKIAAKAAQLPPEFIEQYKKQLRQWALERLISEQLLDEKVKQAHIVVTEEDVIAQLKKEGSLQQPALSLEEIQASVEARGQSFDEYIKQLQTSKGMKYQKFMEPQWAGKINVTEDEARKYYSENPKQFEIPEQVRASHILIKPDTSSPLVDPNEAKAAAKAKAQDLLKQIKQGADFAELAKAHSGGSSAAKGGDLGFFSRGQMVAPFEKAAFQLKPGQLSDVVETRYGYHIIKVTDHKGPGVIPFEQAKDNIINALMRKKQSEFIKEYIQSLKDKADIVYPSANEAQI